MTANTTFTEALTPTKSSKNRTVRWTPCENGTCLCTGKLVIDTDRERVTYGLVELPTTWAGRAVRLLKADGSGECYDVFAHEADDRQDRCGCKGFERFGHCKHTAALRAIAFENRWLTDPRAFAEADTGSTETQEQQPATCDACRGSGQLPGPRHDAYGPRSDYPEFVTCGHCGGAGAVTGDELPECFRGCGPSREGCPF